MGNFELSTLHYQIVIFIDIHNTKLECIFFRNTNSDPSVPPYWRDVGTIEAYWSANLDLGLIAQAFLLLQVRYLLQYGGNVRYLLLPLAQKKIGLDARVVIPAFPAIKDNIPDLKLVTNIDTFAGNISVIR